MQTEIEINELVSQFQQKTLPLAAWTHHAHLTVAAWHLIHYTPEEATCYLRSGIITYNAATGGINGPQNGYHETLTLFWIKAVAGFIRRHPGTDLATICQLFFDSEYAQSSFPLKYYSRDLLFSTKARAFWVDPDVQSLDFL